MSSSRLRVRAAAAAVVSVLVAAIAAPAVHAQTARLVTVLDRPASVVATSGSVSRGRVSGTVSDDRGGPLPGAMVSMLGVTMVATVADDAGHFTLEALPAGEYILRAHKNGFSASPRQLVRVGTGATVFKLQLRRLDAVVATSGSGPVDARPIVAAGFGLPPGTQATAAGDDAAEEGDHPHGESAWRLRHIKRSILKDRNAAVILADAGSPAADAPLFSRAAAVPGFAAAMFGGLPLSGEVNFLTTGAAGAGDLFSTVGVPRGVAYLALGANTRRGEWTVRAAMSEGELSSWIVAGAFKSRPRTHSYDFGVSYSTQEYQGRNPVALAAVTDGSRNVGELYGLGRWAIAPRVTLEYGGRYAHYDYLEQRALFSPRATITIEPLRTLRVRTSVAQRLLAPGAEEFLSPRVAGPWLPPERTFAALGAAGGADAFRVERARSIDFTIEREFEGAYVFGVRRFYQTVDDQLVTLFGLDLPSGPRSVGHYYVASAGALNADGWAVRVSSLSTGRIRGSLEYSRTTAHWLSHGDAAAIAAWAPTAIRDTADELHDVTTSIETDIPETATRVFVLYRLNTGFTRGQDAVTPGLDGRFDLQVNQAIPFSLAGTKWEVLVGVRNLFRDPLQSGSVYDELLVVRPPTRVVGGVLVKF
jgi:TonB dependent receptor/Carboxypeptidase regulatory-like domain